jgi:hypothetical protein
MEEYAEAAPPAPAPGRETARTPPARLTDDERNHLQAVFDSAVPEHRRYLVDRRYPWRPRPYYPVPRTASTLFLVGVLIAAFGAADLAAILFGLVVAAGAAVLGVGPNVLVWRNERRDKRAYDICLAHTVPTAQLVRIADEQSELGVMIWRIQQACDGVRESEARERGLLNGIFSQEMLDAAQYELVSQIVELASERALLAQADGRPALDHVLRPRRAATAARVATITASAEQLESVYAEVAILDEYLTDLRIAEQILGHDSLPISELTGPIAEPGDLQDAAAAVRCVREFVLAHQRSGGPR